MSQDLKKCLVNEQTAQQAELEENMHPARELDPCLIGLPGWPGAAHAPPGSQMVFLSVGAS